MGAIVPDAGVARNDHSAPIRRVHYGASRRAFLLLRAAPTPTATPSPTTASTSPAPLRPTRLSHAQPLFPDELLDAFAQFPRKHTCPDAQSLSCVQSLAHTLPLTQE